MRAVFPCLLASAVLAAPAARADDVQSFPLDSGKVVRGRVVEMKPGQYVVVETADGLQVKIPWSRIQSGAPAAPATPQPRPAPAAAPPKPEPPRGTPEPWRTGFRFGGSVGAAFPYGSARSGSKLSDGFAALFPFALDAGWQFDRRFYVGLYLAYARGVAGGATGDACAQLTCSLYGAAAGVAFEARFPLSPSIAPWGGYRAGWSAQETDITETYGTQQTAFGGVDLANLSGGVDFRLARHFALGPYLGAGLSMYLYQVDALDGGGTKQSIASPTFHGWATLGARVTFTL